MLPKRNTPRLADLDNDETVDLMLSAQKIGNVVEKHYGCTSLTMTIQDGPQAGQTVKRKRKKENCCNFIILTYNCIICL